MCCRINLLKDNLQHAARQRSQWTLELPLGHPGASLMAPPTVSQTLTLAVSARGGTPPGGEDELITSIRQRLNAGAAADSDIVLRTHLLHGLAPLVKYLVRAHSDIGGSDATALGDYAFEGLKIAAYRTKLMKRYAAVIDSTSHWAVVERGSLGVVHGRDPPAPPSLGAPTASTTSSSSPPWWVSNWVWSCGLGSLVVLWMWYSPWLFPSGRGRLQAFALGMIRSHLATAWADSRGPHGTWLHGSRGRGRGGVVGGSFRGRVRRSLYPLAGSRSSHGR